jgi:lysozyme
MKPRHQVSRAALELIESFEGYRRKAARLPDGRWTIGYGHTKTAREGAEVSPQDGEALLIYDLIEVSAAVNDWVFAPLSQNQFDALCAFALNIGLDKFRASQVLRRINEGAVLQAACSMDMWRKAEFAGETIVVDALVRRRAAEKALFLAAPGVHAPTPILPPLLDLEAAGLVPRREPIDVRTDLDGDLATAELPPPVAEAAPATPTPPPVTPTPDDLAAFPQSPLLQDGVDPLAPADFALAEPLQPFLHDETQPAAANESEPEHEPETQPEPEPEEAPVEPAPVVEESAEPDQPAIAEHVSSEFARRVVRPQTIIEGLAPIPDAVEPPARPAYLQPPVIFGGVGALGFLLFAGGVLAAGKGHVAGIALGVIGIICVVVAVYFFLERLGGRED